MLSLCMIVKNEEKNLRRCLSKVVGFIEDIIIVDTGSIDKTKTIAAEFTDKIYDFKWCSDFSKARNFSISKALNDWVLILDADEFILNFSREKINEFINEPLNRNNVGRIERINIMGDSGADKKYVERINRLFNKNYFQYSGSIHEQITDLEGNNYKSDNVSVTVEHIGYTYEVLNRTDKIKRNICMLMDAVKKDKEDPYIYYQLGKSYYMGKDYENSCVYFEKALTFELDSRLEYVEDLIETYGYSLINNCRYSDALILENYLEIYSNSSDFYFLMGLIHMNNGNFMKAIEMFLKCTNFSECKVGGITTYKSFYNIGIIYDVLGFREKAIGYYRMCGEYEPAKKRLD
ncbi:glycosyl transferase [Clostridium sp. 2-1]|uniref:glycosyltransferase n=1 Tax=Clostridium TaxID=1485 RepID=UPI000CDAC584|nr:MULTISPECIES: glycosyltransferase [Clostridium]MBN7573053.1 glycosyltransferase [Clostridium beijerinckii]MBN7578392.1 glycosyltransferase [Clostridium beijerinckii]MBN7582827.1 glycosyltransferase [Clostridium beijerinckii]MBO0518992.1 glycosyltransferase [Clostridium beijerinckii]POO93257.1 glycosyl transferase [Clostridium sp. 2-1]